MPRPKKTIRPIEKRVSLPEDLVARVDMLLYSELQERVPHGAWAELMERLIRQYLDNPQPKAS